MKRLLACLFAFFLAIALTVTFAPSANSAIAPADGLEYKGAWDSYGNPTVFQGADSDRMNGQTFTVSSDGVIRGISFYKGVNQNHQGYGFKGSVYRIETSGVLTKLGDAQFDLTATSGSATGRFNAWFSTPINAVAGTQYAVAVNARNGYFAMELNKFANGATHTANGITMTGGRYVYTNTSGQYYAAPINVTNTNYQISPLFRANTQVPTYPNHTNIVATTFWVGEVFNSQLSDGSQVCSAYDGEWAQRWSANETFMGNAPAGTSCEGSPVGGCDGVYGGTTLATFTCETQQRTSANNYFPTGANTQTPAENPFYLDLPYNDVTDPIAFAERCSVIPWAAAVNAQIGNKCTDSNFSYMKNRWVKMTRGSNVCYGQIQDAGPSTGSLYHDKEYVFGANDARPVNTEYSGDPTQGAGADVSPALVGCLGFTQLNGDTEHMDWRFVERSEVPAGPWTIIETTSGYNWS